MADERDDREVVGEGVPNACRLQELNSQMDKPVAVGLVELPNRDRP